MPMADTALTTSEESRVNVALEALLTENDPKSMSFEEFRGAQYDHGLAWVYFCLLYTSPSPRDS